MPRNPITAPAAAAIGPYSHAIAAGSLVFLSGQTPVEAATGALVTGSVQDQTRQCLTNLMAVLAATDLGEADVVKCNVYLANMADFPAMNEAYAAFFTAPYPARTTVGVAALPLSAAVEIELVAQRR